MTRIIIAHRPATIAHAQEVLSLDGAMLRQRSTFSAKRMAPQS